MVLLWCVLVFFELGNNKRNPSAFVMRKLYTFTLSAFKPSSQALVDLIHCKVCASFTFV